MHHLFDKLRGLGHRHHHDHHHHAGRHGRGFHGFGFRHGMPGEGGLGAGGLGAGRKLGSADLQLLILALLAEKPRHGYEVIKALDERSNGYYSPSPGMVYPALTYLEEIGRATVEVQGSKKLYRITDEGLTYLEENRAAVDSLLEQLAWIGKKMDHVRRAWSSEGGEDDGAEDFDAPDRRGPHGHPQNPFGVAGDLRQARRDLKSALRQAKRNLKSALIEKFDSSETEQQRVAAILERAAAEIRGG